MMHSVVCRQTCEGNVARVAFEKSIAAALTCPAQAQVVVPCAPYSCSANGETCRSQCNADGECASGYVCKESTHECLPLTYSCSQDRSKVVGTDGSQHDCGNYVCRAAACLEQCTNVDDCDSPNICHPSHPHCVPPEY